MTLFANIFVVVRLAISVDASPGYFSLSILAVNRTRYTSSLLRRMVAEVFT